MTGPPPAVVEDVSPFLFRVSRSGRAAGFGDVPNPAPYGARLAVRAQESPMRFRSILLLGVSSVALQQASAQTAGVGGVPGTNVILPRQVPYNRPIYILPGAGDRPY